MQEESLKERFGVRLGHCWVRAAAGGWRTERGLKRGARQRRRLGAEVWSGSVEQRP